MTSDEEADLRSLADTRAGVPGSDSGGPAEPEAATREFPNGTLFIDKGDGEQVIITPDVRSDED